MVVSVVILTGLDKEGAQKGNDADPNKEFHGYEINVY